MLVGTHPSSHFRSNLVGHRVSDGRMEHVGVVEGAGGMEGQGGVGAVGEKAGKLSQAFSSISGRLTNTTQDTQGTPWGVRLWWRMERSGGVGWWREWGSGG